MSTRRAVAAILAVFFVSLLAIPGRAQGISPLDGSAEKLGTSPPPAWVEEGRRLVYHVATSAQAFPGQRLRPGMAAEGYLQVDVIAKTKKKVVVTFRNLQGHTKGDVALTGEQAAVATPGYCAGYWVNPDALQKFVKGLQPAGPIKASETDVTIGKQKYHGIRLQMGGGARDLVRLVAVYDKKSGMLVSSLRSQRLNAQVQFMPIADFELESSRVVKLPWRKGRPPDWLAKLTSCRFEGTQSMSQPGLPPVKLPLTFDVTVKERGPNWILCNYEISLGKKGTFGFRKTALQRASGSSQIGGLYIPPLSIPKLTEGQVLDEDPVTGVKVTVTFVGKARYGRDVVRIVEDGGGYRLVVDYERDNGMLMHSRLDTRATHQTVETYFTKKQE